MPRRRQQAHNKASYAEPLAAASIPQAVVSRTHVHQPLPTSPLNREHADWDADSDDWTVAEDCTRVSTTDSHSPPAALPGRQSSTPDQTRRIQPDPDGFYSAADDDDEEEEAAEAEEFGSGSPRGVRHVLLLLLQPPSPPATASAAVPQPSPSPDHPDVPKVPPLPAAPAPAPVMLSQFPGRALCVPSTQPPVWLTADRAAERQALAEALAGDPQGG